MEMPANKDESKEGNHYQHDIYHIHRILVIIQLFENMSTQISKPDTNPRKMLMQKTGKVEQVFTQYKPKTNYWS